MPPAGAVTVDPAVDNDLYNKTIANPPGTTFWLAPGTHTLGTSEFGQVIPKDGDIYLGAPGAVLDGRGVNQFAFTQHASNVTIQYLTIQGFNANGQYGINAYQAGDGITGLVVVGNEIAGNNADDLETKEPGCGCTGGAKFWAVNGADVRSNWIHDNHSVGLWIDTDNNDFLIENNLIEKTTPRPCSTRSATTSSCATTPSAGTPG